MPHQEIRMRRTQRLSPADRALILISDEIRPYGPAARGSVAKTTSLRGLYGANKPAARRM